jgi:hypothetical protein
LINIKSVLNNQLGNHVTRGPATGRGASDKSHAPSAATFASNADTMGNASGSKAAIASALAGNGPDGESKTQY